MICELFSWNNLTAASWRSMSTKIIGTQSVTRRWSDQQWSALKVTKYNLLNEEIIVIPPTPMYPNLDQLNFFSFKGFLQLFVVYSFENTSHAFFFFLLNPILTLLTRARPSQFSPIRSWNPSINEWSSMGPKDPQYDQGILDRTKQGSSIGPRDHP